MMDPSNVLGVHQQMRTIGRTEDPLLRESAPLGPGRTRLWECDGYGSYDEDRVLAYEEASFEAPTDWQGFDDPESLED